MSRYVLTRLLPQVEQHLPRAADGSPGKRADGCYVTVTGVQLPLVYEHLVVGDFQSVRPFYVAYCEGEPAEYLSPARFRTLVKRHRAWVVASPPRPGGFVLRTPTTSQATAGATP